MGFFRDDEYDRYNTRDDIRQALQDDRRYNSRRYDDDEDLLEWMIKLLLIVIVSAFIIAGILYFIAGWVDSHFGTNFTELVHHILEQIGLGNIGKPSE